MKPNTRLDSAVFQLTPTRTRCDLVVTANGETVKITSGLLDPFLAHLKTAQDQVTKGGYSIILEPDSRSDVSWFTKDTVERFVRFVSTPEVLERVNTIESEILQIDEAIVIQGNDNLCLSTQIEDHQTRSTKGNEGSKPIFDADAEKAIVLFKPGVKSSESNGSTTQEENSKVQLLRALETRKTLLQKEQSMAFARAVAAGFDMDRMMHLMSFAKCFGASRLLEACLRFMDLWKREHERGQWLDTVAAEAMSSQTEISSMNMLSDETKIQKEYGEAWPEPHGEFYLESNGKTSNNSNADATTQHLSSDYNRDKMPPMDSQVPLGLQGQFQHPMYPQWPISSLPGAPFFPTYPTQGMPYYQNYPGPVNGSFFQPPYPPMEDSRFNAAQMVSPRRHSRDGKDSTVEPEAWEMSLPNTGTGDCAAQSISDFDKEVSQGRESRRKGGGRASRKQSGMVVIRNINYITSKRKIASGGETQSITESENEEETVDVQSDAPERKHKNVMRSSKSKQSVILEEDGNWQAFQNCLLRDNEERSSVRGIFSGEKEAHLKRRQGAREESPILPSRQDLGEEIHNQRMNEFDVVNGKMTGMYRKASNDELAVSRDGIGSSQMDVKFREIEVGGGRYRKVTKDDFMFYGRENQLDIRNSPSNPRVGNGFERADNLDKSSSCIVTDESFLIPFRSSSQDQVGTDTKTAIDVNSETPSVLWNTLDSSSRIRTQRSYEPGDLSLMQERKAERESIGYHPSVDYEMKVHAKDAAMLAKINQEVLTGVKGGLKKSDKEKKLRVVRDGLGIKKMEATMKKGKPSKLSPLTAAQDRAERLRAFKADLQKLKKEKEAEEIKRLEILKRERQKRIASRGSLSPAQLPLQQTRTQLPTKLSPNSNKVSKFSGPGLRSSSPMQKFPAKTTSLGSNDFQQTRTQLPTKFSPCSEKGSKFSGSELRSSSPMRKFPIRSASLGSGDTQKRTLPRRFNGGHLIGNELSRLASSLPDVKKDSNRSVPETKAAPIRTKRLSDPKSSSLKSGRSEPVRRPKFCDDSEIKKKSAITSLDRIKSETLPELRVKTVRDHSDLIRNKLNVNGTKSSQTSESTKMKKNNEKALHCSKGDENPVIEKTVVMIGNEMGLVPTVQSSEESIEMRKGSYHGDNGKKTEEMVSGYVAICAPTAPIVKSEVDQADPESQFVVRPNSHDVCSKKQLVKIDYAPDELSKLSPIRIEKPYQAPYARASSLEDLSTLNLEYSSAPPLSFKPETRMETAGKAHVSNPMDTNSFEQIPEAIEKPQDKEFPKGFRRLLKFGRKNRSSPTGDHNVYSDDLGIDGSANDNPTATASSSSEVHSLKNLICQDESCTESTPPKVSRPFSLLSPFRTRTKTTSEKKPIRNKATIIYSPIIYKV